MIDIARWRYVLRLAFGLVLACLGWLVQAQTTELREATATVTVQGQTTQQRVSLPYHWDRQHPGLAGEAMFELPFNLQAVPSELYALYLPRLGNAYEVWLNGVLIQHNGDLKQGNGPDFAKAPRLIEISPGLLSTRNLLRIHIRTDVGRRGGLAPLSLGPVDEVSTQYLYDYHWRITGSLVMAIGSLLIGLVVLGLWATQLDMSASGHARRDPLYLYAALAQLSWTLNVSDAFIESPILAWPWWGVVSIFATAMWSSNIALFCVEVAGWRTWPAVIWLRRWLWMLLLASVAAAVAALWYGHPQVLTLLYAMLGLTFLVFAGVFIWKAARGSPLAHRLVAFAALLNTGVGLRDVYSFRISQTYGGNTWLRYSSMLFGLTLFYIVITRFRAVSRQAHDLSVNLALRVAQKEQELVQAYQRMELLAREQERTGERTRILRDMHDGVGSHISTAIRQLESGRASSGEVLHTLRDSLDQLKLSIDAMNLPAGDITSLLANLRYRLEPRMKASDIALCWDVDLLEPLARLDDKAMRHLQFMVFEALSNAMQHAQARTLRIELHGTSKGGAQLLVVDDGCGFEPEQVKRRGLSSLRERAKAIDARLQITSAPGQTVVEIMLD